MTQDIMQYQINSILEEKVEELFLAMQEEYGIQYGDVEPLDAFELEEVQGKMVEVIEKILRKQCGK